jgi:hypothetical protein
MDTVSAGTSINLLGTCLPVYPAQTGAVTLLASMHTLSLVAMVQLLIRAIISHPMYENTTGIIDQVDCIMLLSNPVTLVFAPVLCNISTR